MVQDCFTCPAGQYGTCVCRHIYDRDTIVLRTMCHVMSQYGTTHNPLPTHTTPTIPTLLGDFNSAGSELCAEQCQITQGAMDCYACPFGNACEGRRMCKLGYVCVCVCQRFCLQGFWGGLFKRKTTPYYHTKQLTTLLPPLMTTATAASSAWSARPGGSRWTGSASTRPPPPSPSSSAWPSWRRTGGTSTRVR